MESFQTSSSSFFLVSQSSASGLRKYSKLTIKSSVLSSSKRGRHTLSKLFTQDGSVARIESFKILLTVKI